VLSGVVYRVKSIGPRTEPRGTPHEQVREEERLLLHSHEKSRKTGKT